MQFQYHPQNIVTSDNGMVFGQLPLLAVPKQNPFEKKVNNINSTLHQVASTFRQQQQQVPQQPQRKYTHNQTASIKVNGKKLKVDWHQWTERALVELGGSATTKQICDYLEDKYTEECRMDDISHWRAYVSDSLRRHHHPVCSGNRKRKSHYVWSVQDPAKIESKKPTPFVPPVNPTYNFNLAAPPVKKTVGQLAASANIAKQLDQQKQLEEQFQQFQEKQREESLKRKQQEQAKLQQQQSAMQIVQPTIQAPVESLQVPASFQPRPVQQSYDYSFSTNSPLDDVESMTTFPEGLSPNSGYFDIPEPSICLSEPTAMDSDPSPMASAPSPVEFQNDAMEFDSGEGMYDNLEDIFQINCTFNDPLMKIEDPFSI